jgi:subtilisin-like proprotein convertase family protein
MKFASFLRFFKGQGVRSNRRGKRQREAQRTPRRERTLLRLEGLEERTLLSVVPTPTVIPPQDISFDGNIANESAPSLAVDPNNAQNVAVFWTLNDPRIAGTQKVFLQGAFSTNGGATYQQTGFFFNLIDPTSAANNPQPFVQATDASVAFDRTGNFYVMVSEHDAANVEGAIVLEKFNFSGGVPVQLIADNVIYAWSGRDAAVNPTMAVDTNLASFTDPDTGAVQTDTSAGNIYVAFSTINTPPGGNAAQGFNPNSIKLLASSDGGQTFGSQTYINDGFSGGDSTTSSVNFGPERNTQPRIAISQGTPVLPGSNLPPRVPGGQVTIVWDDFGTGATANPPFDEIKVDHMSGVSGRSFGQTLGPLTGGIADALSGGNNGPSIPVTTSFSVAVNLASDTHFTKLSDLDVSLDMIDPNVDQLQIDLIPPSSSGLPAIPLALNHVDANNNAIAGQGFVQAGANLGVQNGRNVGFTFDDQAPRGIQDSTATAPYLGHFRTEFGGFFGAGLTQFNGLSGAQLGGTWTLAITDFRSAGNTPPTQFLRDWSLNFTGASVLPGFDNTVAFPFVRGAVTSPFPLAPAVSPDRGIGPSPVIASDNTLGSFSPFQGRLYLAYVDHIREVVGNVDLNPTDNTDIFMITSDDGGNTWSSSFGGFTGFGGATTVNDDNAAVDGFTEGNNLNNLAIPAPQKGRPQFEPSLVVDPDTGMLVASWYDARNDAARARVATYFTTSIDGGTTFSKQTYFNAAHVAKDAITGKTINVEPIPDNQSSGNGSRDATFGFGDHQGLAVLDGTIYAAWSGNQDGLNDPTNDLRLDIFTGSATTAGGPRIINSTMGPVRSLTIDGTNFNNTFTFDGTQLANAFEVEFDRPIDPATFTKDAVTVVFRNPTTPANLPGVTLDVLSVVDLNPAPTGTALPDHDTRFLVRFDSLKALTQGGTYTGTYSYAVGPNIRDRIRVPKISVTPNPGTTTFSAVSPQVPKTIPDAPQFFVPGTALSTITISNAQPQDVVADLNINLTITHTFDQDLVLTLIAPDGTQVLLSGINLGGGFIIGHGGAGRNYTNTTFDDQAATPIGLGTPPFTGSFKPDSPLAQLIGKPLNGIWTLQVQDVEPADTGTLISWSMIVQSGTISSAAQTGNLMDQNANGVTGEQPAAGVTVGDVYAAPRPLGKTLFTAPYDPDTLPIIVPGPHVVKTIAGNSQTAPVTNRFDAPLTEINKTIPPAGTGGSGVASQDTTTSALIVNTDPNALITNLTVTVNISHTRDSDLVLRLIGPDGTVVNLASHVGGTGADFFDTTFDSNAALAIGQGTAPFTGSFRPEGGFGLFNGKTANGTWTLEITDTVSGETGTLNAWSLNVSTINPTLVLNNFVDHVDVVFDRDMDPNSFTPASILNMTGPAGLIAPLRDYKTTFTPQVIPDRPNTVAITPLDSFLLVPDDLPIGALSVTVNISHARDHDLVAYLFAPDGTRVQLFQQVGGAVGADFTGTTFDDSAAVPITFGVAPFAGVFRPAQPLNALIGHNAKGAWKLEIQDLTSNGIAGTLNSWVLHIRPAITVTSNPDPLHPDPDPQHPRTFRISFPPQMLSGTYTIQLASTIRAANGEALDQSLNAGLDILKGINSTSSLSGPQNFSNPSSFSLKPGKVTLSTITIPASADFIIQDVNPQLDVTFPHDKLLLVTLTGPDGTQVTLFDGRLFVNALGPNLANTIFDDQATTPILSGVAPFSSPGSYTPLSPLSVFNGKNAAGTWVLSISDLSTNSTDVGLLNKWTLNFTKPISGSGLGEPVADSPTVSFRIFTVAADSSLAHNVWTALGSGSITTSGGNAETGQAATSTPRDHSGRIGGIAVDPSDPTGNTVYVAGASGGVWKTNNFLTPDPNGPTYIPLTDFGPTNAINVGGIGVFGRNNDPNQSIVFVGTGEGDALSAGQDDTHTEKGVGVLRSFDGGSTWTLLDSTTNVDGQGNPLPINSSLRDHLFVGLATFRVVVDPVHAPSSPDNVIVYAAMSDPSGRGRGGVYRSTDSGKHWTLTGSKSGQATDVILGPNTSSDSSGNTQVIDAAFEGEGVFQSPNQGGSWNLMTGGATVQAQILDIDVAGQPQVPVVTPAGITPNGAKGRITLAAPAATGNKAVDLGYQNWLYAFVATPGGATDGLYVTKDAGYTWTKIRLPALPNLAPGLDALIPTNDQTQSDYDPLSNGSISQGNYDMSLAVDPTNPNIVYVGGTADAGLPPGGGFLRVDITRMHDTYNMTGFNYDNPDGGALRPNTGGVTLKDPLGFFGLVTSQKGQPLTLDPNEYLNLIRSPIDPLNSSSQLFVTNIRRFNNDGTDVSWTGLSGDILTGSTDQHRLVVIKDPLTGHARLIIGDDQGVFTGVDMGDGTLSNGIGTAVRPTGARNGNLQVTQFYYGAVQPSILAADIAGALFYGQAQDDGSPASDANILGNGNLTWTGPAGDGGGVATDQTGGGFAYRYNWPCCGGLTTSFFQVTPPGGTALPPPFGSSIGRTNGLLQPGDDPARNQGQWPFGGNMNFAVNPINGNQIVIGSASGQVFRTLDQGLNWFSITPNPNGTPGSLDATQAKTFAFGAPDPNASVNEFGNFIYAGTIGGKIFVTFIGGGSVTNSGNTGWKDISAGLDGSEVRSIVTSPVRGSHEAYAVTLNGVYHLTDSSGNATWTRITGNLFSIKHNPFGDPALSENQLKYLQALVADWRFADPTTAKPPYLYVGGDGGVFRSTDGGKTWAIFPSIAGGAPVDGGYLPNAAVTDLDLSLGNINPTTGKPDQATGPDMLIATTYGRGAFAIRLDANLIPGPHVVSLVPGTPVATSIAAVDITFSGPVDPTTFTTADILSFLGPNNTTVRVTTIADLTVDPTAPNAHRSYRLTFDTPVTGDGAYTLVLNPTITDFAGDALDQNQNGINGEAVADRFTGVFVINTTDNGRFESGLYHDVLKRTSDSAGFQVGVNAAESTRFAALPGIAAIYVTSDEDRTLLVNQFYQGTGVNNAPVGNLQYGNFLRRPADTGAVAFYVQAMKNGVTPEQVMTALLASDEYYNGNYYNSTETDLNKRWIEQVYTDLFGPNVSADTDFTAQILLADLNSGTKTRAQVLGVIFQSDLYLGQIGPQSQQPAGKNVIQSGYNLYLNRNPSPGEYQLWNNFFRTTPAVAGKPSPTEQFLISLVSSGEYFFKQPDANGLHTDVSWVTSLYKNVLLRAPDQVGLNAGVNALINNAGAVAGRTFAAAVVTASNEYKSILVTRWYQQYLGRAPLPSESAFWVGVLASPGMTDERVQSMILGSSEFFFRSPIITGAGGSPTLDTFVDAVYAEVLNRAPDAASHAAWVNMLRKGTTTLSGFAFALLRTDEYHATVVEQFYEQYLKFAPGSVPADAINFWTVALRTQSDEQVLDQFLASQTYFQLTHQFP